MRVNKKFIRKIFEERIYQKNSHFKKCGYKYEIDRNWTLIKNKKNLKLFLENLGK